MKPSLAVLSCLSLLAVAIPPSSSAEDEMNQTIDRAEAIELANKEFVRQGNDLEKFDVSADPRLSEDRYWIVWYDRKGPFRVPGGKHLVRVDTVTGQSTFLKGQ
jgi:hypothetical protein